MPRSSTVTTRPVRSAAPATVHHTVETTQTLGQSIKQGFGFSIGSAIAHRIFGAPSVTVEQKKTPTAYEQCIAEHRDDVALCAHLAEKK